MSTWFTAVVVVLLMAGCGSSPTRPSPAPITPAPTHITVSGTITNTSTGAAVGSFSQEVHGLPAFVTVAADGFLSRETWIHSQTPTVDLIRDAAPFDLAFYRLFARNTTEPLRTLAQAPSIYFHTAGLSTAQIVASERRARAIVHHLTGGTLSVAAWETGLEPRAVRNDWITVALVQEPDAPWCGRARTGAIIGEIELNRAAMCDRPLEDTFAHELGHALGFAHVPDLDALMNTGRPRGIGLPSSRELYHAAIAYRRPRGNMDIDRDPRAGSMLSAGAMVLD